MQYAMFDEYEDYSEKKVLIGLSGGINSMAVLCWIARWPEECKPKELHLFYAHLEEHSPDTRDFVLAGVEYAKKHFKKVLFKETQNSVIEFFEQQNMIPHPIVSPCTRVLKIIPMAEYMAAHSIDVDLVGYVREESRRVKRMIKKAPAHTVAQKAFPIRGKENEWCFSIVEREIGWYPAIYNIKNSKGKRVFKHNNCLPCKNMAEKDFELVKKHYPAYHKKATALAKRIGKHWGRKKGDLKSSCEFCEY